MYPLITFTSSKHVIRVWRHVIRVSAIIVQGLAYVITNEDFLKKFKWLAVNSTTI